MDAQKTLAALGSVKEIAAKFSAFAIVADAADTIAALVNHEDELKKSIEAKQAEIAQLRADHADELAAHTQRLADAQAEHANYVKQYDAHREKLRSDALAVEAESQSKIAAAQAQVQTAEAQATRDIKAHEAFADARKGELAQSLAVFEASHKQARAEIEAQTAALQKRLDDLREQVAPLMNSKPAVEPPKDETPATPAA